METPYNVKNCHMPQAPGTWQAPHTANQHTHLSLLLGTQHQPSSRTRSYSEWLAATPLELIATPAQHQILKQIVQRAAHTHITAGAHTIPWPLDVSLSTNYRGTNESQQQRYVPFFFSRESDTSYCNKKEEIWSRLNILLENECVLH